MSYSFLDQPRIRATRELLSPAEYGRAVERYRRKWWLIRAALLWASLAISAGLIAGFVAVTAFR